MLNQNPFQRMRIGSVMGASRPSPTYPNQSPVVQPHHGVVEDDDNMDDDSRYFDELLRMRHQTGPAMSAYKQSLAAVPNAEDYKPNWLTRIAAGLSGLSAGVRNPAAGVQTAMGLNRAGYENAVNDWTTKLKGQGEGARIEEAEHDGEMKDLTQAYGMRMKYRDYLLKRDKQGHDMDIADEKLGVDRQNANTNAARAQAYIQAQNRADLDFIPQQDGSILQIDKRSGKREVVPAHTVAAYSAQTGRISANASASSADAAQQNAKTNARRANIYESYVGKYGTTRPQSATDQTRAMDLALRQMYMDPDWRKFITADDKGIFDPGDPSDFSPEEWKLFQEELMDRMGHINKGGR
jgi:hypothetical protein